jgi:hypothetical protein
LIIGILLLDQINEKESALWDRREDFHAKPKHAMRQHVMPYRKTLKRE